MTKRTGNKVSMPVKEFEAEHKRLGKLASISKLQLKAEAKDQTKELKEVMKKNPGPKYEPKGGKEEGKKHEKAESKSFERKEHKKGK